MSGDVFAELRGLFRENTRARVAEMLQLIARLREAPADADARTLLHRHFHGLAGLGTTYGHPAITAAGEEGEALCEAGALPAATLDRLAELSGIVERDVAV